MIFGIAIYIFLQYGKSIRNFFILLFSLGGLAAIFERLIIRTNIICDVFFRRILLIPALLNYQYYSYFTENPKNLYASSIGGWFGVQSNYSSDIARVIGVVYYGNADANANNGLFSDAYANLGLVGCIIMPILLILVLKIADGGSEKIPRSIWVVSAIGFFFSFSGSSFFTVLLTHGAIIIIILFYIMNAHFDVDGEAEPVSTNRSIYFRGLKKEILS